MIPEYLASLIQTPEKFWPESRWGARAKSGEAVWVPTAEEALEKLKRAIKAKDSAQN